MEIIILILIVLVIFVFVLPIAAMGQASGASGKVASLERKIERLMAEMETYRGLHPTIKILQRRLQDLEERCARLDGGSPSPSEKRSEVAGGGVSTPVARVAGTRQGDELTSPIEVEPGREAAGPVVPEEPLQVAKLVEPEPVGQGVAGGAPGALRPDAGKALAKRAVTEAEPQGGSLEMKLGTYWFVRIGVVLLLTGAGIFAYYKKQFFFDLSPSTKVGGLYLLSALLGGVGFWLQRAKEKFNNYGQVLLAGGFSGVYFTTYAAHIIPPVLVIPNPTVALLMLFAWGALIVWVADRLKSETLALFAIGASYYATYVPLIHSGGVSHWVILASNLILAVAAVVFMLRNRWLRMPVLSMSAAYTGFLVWRLRVLEDPSLALVLLFACSLWVVYTAAVFLSNHKDFDDQRRAAFLTANNSALFGLLAWDVLRDYEAQFWILPLVLGVVLLGCALGASRALKEQLLSRHSYLTQGLVLVTLGLMTSQLSESVKGPMFAAQSVLLLFMAIRRGNGILEVGAIAVAMLGVFSGFQHIGLKGEDYLLSGLCIGAFLLFNGWLAHRGLEADDGLPLRRRVSYFTTLGVALGVLALVVKGLEIESERVPAILISATALFCASGYFLRLREFVLIGQVPAIIGLLWSIGLADETAEFTWPLFSALLLTLGLAHWWRWQGRGLDACGAESGLARQFSLVAEGVYSVGVTLLVLVWIHARIGAGIEWLVLGSLLTLGLVCYGVLTRAPFMAALGHVFLCVACGVQMNSCLTGIDADGLRALVPIATLACLSLIIPVAVVRIGEIPEFFRPAIPRIQATYRLAAGTLGLLWIYRFVPDDYRLLVTALAGALFLLANRWRSAEEWRRLATGYLMVSALYLVVEFGRQEATWQSWLAIVGLLVMQQLARRRGEVELSEYAQSGMILGGGIAMFFWVTINVSDLMPGGEGHGLRSIAWALMAVVYFALGLKLKERWYRLMSLGILGVALLSLVPIIWEMSTELKIASFFVLGLVFVGLGFVYNRNREQIKKLL